MFLAGSFMFAQSADVVSKILDAQEVTFGQVCYMSAVHQKLISDKASMSDAIKALVKNEQISEAKDQNYVPSLQEIAAIVTKMWPQVNDSVMYRITGGAPRYAYKLLKSKGVIRPGFDAEQKISGRDFLNILTTAMMTFNPESEGMTMEVN